jgi:hypothetical protein
MFILGCGIDHGYEAELPGFESFKGKVFLFSTKSRPALELTSLLSNGYRGPFSTG